MQLIRYFLIITIASFIVCASTTWLANKGLQKSGVDFYGKINAAEDTSNGTNLLLVGSSRMLIQADPDIFDSITGLRSYNFGFNAGTIKTCYNVIKYALHFQKGVKAVVLNIDYNMFDISNDPYKDAYYYPFEKKIEGLLLSDTGNTRLIHRLQFLDISLYDDFAKYSAIDGWIRPSRVVEGQKRGYYPHYTVNDFEIPPQRNLNKVIAPFSETGLNFLKKCIALCKQKNVKLILVMAPYYKEYSPDKYNSNFYEIIDKVKTLANQSGIPFHDYTSMEISKQQDCFYNVNHLNVNGAKFYSIAVADSLKKFLLSSTRD